MNEIFMDGFFYGFLLGDIIVFLFLVLILLILRFKEHIKELKLLKKFILQKGLYQEYKTFENKVKIEYNEMRGLV